MLISDSHSHWPELCHMAPLHHPVARISGKVSLKKGHINMISLTNHDLSSEAGHIATLNKLLNRDYLGDNPYFIRTTISYFKLNCKHV